MYAFPRDGDDLKLFDISWRVRPLLGQRLQFAHVGWFCRRKMNIKFEGSEEGWLDAVIKLATNLPKPLEKRRWSAMLQRNEVMITTL